MFLAADALKDENDTQIAEKGKVINKLKSVSSTYDIYDFINYLRIKLQDLTILRVIDGYSREKTC